MRVFEPLLRPVIDPQHTPETQYGMRAYIDTTLPPVQIGAWHSRNNASVARLEWFAVALRFLEMAGSVRILTLHLSHYVTRAQSAIAR